MKQIQTHEPCSACAKWTPVGFAMGLSRVRPQGKCGETNAITSCGAGRQCPMFIKSAA